VIPFFGSAFAVTDRSDGFTTARRTARPAPRGAQLSDFVPTSTRNRFNIMRREDEPEERKVESKQKKTIKAMKGKTRSVAALDSTLMSCLAKSSVDELSQLDNFESAVLAAINEHKTAGGSICMINEECEMKVLGEPGRAITPEPTTTITTSTTPTGVHGRTLQHDGRVPTEADGDHGKTTATTVATTRPHELQAPPRNADGTLVVPLTCVQKCENIALQFPTLAKTCYREIARAKTEETDELYRDLKSYFNTANLIFDDDDDEPEGPELVAVASDKVRVGVAVDSGASDNVIGLDDLPAGVVPEGPVGPPFSNASGGDIKKYGKVVTMMESSDGKVGCGWTACAVTRPLHSVSKIAGPEDGPGVQDVMFNNRIGVVMPPGLVELLLKHIKPVARYPRRGGLYVGDFEMSSFPRQGPAR
jgi:hypothetical protein